MVNCIHGMPLHDMLQEGTGRIVMWNSMGIRNSYTMEVGILHAMMTCIVPL